jgi:hypothetical protein
MHQNIKRVCMLPGSAPVPSNPVPSRPVPSHPIPSRPVPSCPILSCCTDKRHYSHLAHFFVLIFRIFAPIVLDIQHRPQHRPHHTHETLTPVLALRVGCGAGTKAFVLLAHMHAWCATVSRGNSRVPRGYHVPSTTTRVLASTTRCRWDDSQQWSTDR